MALIATFCIYKLLQLSTLRPVSIYSPHGGSVYIDIFVGIYLAYRSALVKVKGCVLHTIRSFCVPPSTPLLAITVLAENKMKSKPYPCTDPHQVEIEVFLLTTVLIK